MGFCAYNTPRKLLLHSTPVGASIKQERCQRYHHGCSFFSQAKNWFAVKYFNRLRNYGFAIGSASNARAKDKTILSTQVEEEEESCLRTRSLVNLEEVEKIIGYNFQNRKLLRQAFTHSTCQKCVSYERLEFIGDSVLNLLISKQHFFMYPKLPPGLLTPLRAANVDTEKLARAAVKHKLQRYLRHEKPLLRKQIQEFMNSLPNYPLHSHGVIDAPKVLADIVESTIGAVFVDSNSSVDTTWEVAKVLLEPMITPEMLQTNPVTKLYEICQKNGLEIRFVDRWSQEGAYEVFVDSKLRGRGEYQAKKEIAFNRAAENAYNNITRSGLIANGR